MTNTTTRRLVASGAILFLLGLLTGLGIPMFANPRMGLASHLEGVMNGTFLIALGAAWPHVRLNGKLELATLVLLLYGSFANWAFVSIAAVFGTSEMTPIAGAGYSGSAIQETIVNFGLLSVALTMLTGCALLVYGLIAREKVE